MLMRTGYWLKVSKRIISLIKQSILDYYINLFSFADNLKQTNVFLRGVVKQITSKATIKIGIHKYKIFRRISVLT